MPYTVYILQCADNSLYTGITNNLEKRLETHRAGLGSKYVRAHLPFELKYTEIFETKSEALRREIEIKKLAPSEKRRLFRG